MQTQTITQIVQDWQDEFRLFLEQDYRKVSPTRHQLGEKSVKAACQHVRVFGLWWEAKYQDGFEPRKITSFDLHAYRQHSLEDARVAPDTWNARHWALGIMCQWIQSTLGPSYANLMDGIEQKKSGLRPGRYRSLTDQEYGYLVHRIERRTREAVTTFEYQTAVRNQAMVSVMLFAGLRVDEASMLDVSDITINERSGSVRIRAGKGDKERIVPLNLTARRALEGWVNVRGNATANGLFVGKQTERVTTRQIERIVSDLGAECRIEGMSPHWLRYTFGKRLESKGASIEQIRDLLGHESIETTRRYLRASFAELQSVMEGI